MTSENVGVSSFKLKSLLELHAENKLPLMLWMWERSILYSPQNFMYKPFALFFILFKGLLLVKTAKSVLINYRFLFVLYPMSTDRCMIYKEVPLTVRIYWMIFLSLNDWFMIIWRIVSKPRNSRVIQVSLRLITERKMMRNRPLAKNEIWQNHVIIFSSIFKNLICLFHACILKIF